MRYRTRLLSRMIKKHTIGMQHHIQLNQLLNFAGNCFIGPKFPWLQKLVEQHRR